MMSADNSHSPMKTPTWVRERAIVALALTLSAALHALAYFATPFFILAWREPAAARFEAVLLPAEESPIETFSAPKSVATPSHRPVAKSISPKTLRPRRTEERFVAPENAIAVESSPSAADAVAIEEKKITPPDAAQTMEALEKTTVATESSPPTNVAAAAPVAESVSPKPELPPEKLAAAPVELPARIAIAYRMTSSISDGVADYTWTRNGQQFEIDSSMQATGFIIGNLVGVLHQVSTGTITPVGLQPSTFRIRRGEGAQDTAEFLYATNELKLTRSGNPARIVPLTPQLQDIQSFLFQLAYDAPGLKKADDRLEVMVTNARKVYRHRFRQLGIEAVQMRSGAVQTMHLRSEAADPEDTYEVWLAPDNYHLPVRIKFYAGRFPVELIATSIRTTP